MAGDEGKKGEQSRVDCFSCLHFHITYEPQFPYGCRAMGFKSRQMPALAVYSSSGMVCQAFEPRRKRKRE